MKTNRYLSAFGEPPELAAILGDECELGAGSLARSREDPTLSAAAQRHGPLGSKPHYGWRANFKGTAFEISCQLMRLPGQGFGPEQFYMFKLAREYAMKHSFKCSTILSIGLLGIGGSASATQPPDVITSDTVNNTAMGTNALLNLNAEGYDNLAVGVDSMYENTSGNSNVAVGNSALSNNLDGNANFAPGTGALVHSIHGCNNVAVGPTRSIISTALG